MKRCHLHSHMTISRLNGEDTLIWNWSCLPHGIWRKSYTGRASRDEAMKKHLKKHLKKEKKK